MKINRTLLDLITMYANFSQAEIFQMLTELKGTKEELDDIIIDFKDESIYDEDIANNINLIKEQLSYINQNIRTLEDVLLCHQSKIFQKMTANNKVANVCLN